MTNKEILSPALSKIELKKGGSCTVKREKKKLLTGVWEREIKPNWQDEDATSIVIKRADKDSRGFVFFL